MKVRYGKARNPRKMKITKQQNWKEKRRSNKKEYEKNTRLEKNVKMKGKHIWKHVTFETAKFKNTFNNIVVLLKRNHR